MFSVLCVCLFTGGSHVTITYDALDMSIKSGAPPPSQLTALQTRMHSSRMRTASNSGRRSGGLHQAPTSPRSRHPPGSRHPPPRGQNSWHTLLKILPCPKLRLRAVNIDALRDNIGISPVHGHPLPRSHRLDMFKLVHYEACTVGKWAVGILLEWFLVFS